MELLIVMIIVSGLLAFFIPALRLAQKEAIRSRIDGDLRVITAALKVYQEKANRYPEGINYQQQLIGSSPQLLDHQLNDPFSDYGDKPYIYKLSPNRKYFLLYSVGTMGSTQADINDIGKITFITGSPSIEKWISNGSL